MITFQTEWHETGAYLSAGAHAGWLRPVVERSYAFTTADVQQVHVDVMDHSAGAKGKLTIDVGGAEMI